MYTRGVNEDLPAPIGQSVEEALLKIMRPDLLTTYQQEKGRHREEKKAIDEVDQAIREKTSQWPIRSR